MLEGRKDENNETISVSSHVPKPDLAPLIEFLAKSRLGNSDNSDSTLETQIQRL